MGTTNPVISGGFPSGSNSSSNALTVTGASDFAFLSNTFDVTVGIALAAAGAGTLNGNDQFLSSQKGVKVVIDVTAVGGTPSMVVKIQGKDLLSNKYYDMLASAAITAVGTTVLTLYPGVPTTANLFANDHLPAGWRVTATISGGTPSVTGTISATVLS